MSSLRHRINRMLRDAFQAAGVRVPHLLHERPYRAYPCTGGVLRVGLRAPCEGAQALEVTCVMEELENPAFRQWLVETYKARNERRESPQPPVPVSLHWQVYGADRCNYLWTLAAFDAYAPHGSLSALRPYDPRLAALRPSASTP